MEENEILRDATPELVAATALHVDVTRLVVGIFGLISVAKEADGIEPKLLERADLVARELEALLYRYREEVKGAGA